MKVKAISDKKWLELSRKRVDNALKSCEEGKDSPIYKLIQKVYGSADYSHRILYGAAQDLYDFLKVSKISLKSAADMSSVHIKVEEADSERKISLINQNIDEARDELKESVNYITDHVQRFGGQFFEHALESGKDGYKNLLRAAEETLPEGELHDFYHRELFLKKWFNAESPNEVDVEAVFEQIKRLPKLSKRKVSEFVECIDAYFPEYENKLYLAYELVGSEMIEKNRLRSATAVYTALGDVDLVNMLSEDEAPEGHVTDLKEITQLDNRADFKHAVIKHCLTHDRYLDELRKLLKRMNKPLESDKFMQRVLAKERPPILYWARRDAWYKLGVKFGNEKKPKKARECFKWAIAWNKSEDKILELMHAKAKAQLHIAELEFEKENFGEARKEYSYAIDLDYKKILEKRPNDIDALLYLSYTWARYTAASKKGGDPRSVKFGLKESKKVLKEALKRKDDFNIKQREKARDIAKRLDMKF